MARVRDEITGQLWKALCELITPAQQANLETLFVVGEESDARIVVRPRKDRPLEISRPLKDYRGGKVVCRAGKTGVADPHGTGRLRAAQFGRP